MSTVLVWTEGRAQDVWWEPCRAAISTGRMLECTSEPELEPEQRGNGGLSYKNYTKLLLVLHELLGSDHSNYCITDDASFSFRHSTSPILNVTWSFTYVWGDHRLLCLFVFCDVRTCWQHLPPPCVRRSVFQEWDRATMGQHLISIHSTISTPLVFYYHRCRGIHWSDARYRQA